MENVCKICGEILNKNHLRIHKISTKEYHLKYIDPKAGKCVCCGTQTAYINSKMGFFERCMLCANREVANNKRKKYEFIRNKNIKIVNCKICKKDFKTNKNVDICSSRSCRIYNPSESKDYLDIKFDKGCPYCGKEINTKPKLRHHLRKHFPINKIDFVYEYLWKYVWKLPMGICKNLNCNNECDRKRSDIFHNFCNVCRKEDSKLHTGYCLKFLKTKEELKDIHKKRSSSNIKTRKNQMSTSEGILKWKRIWGITAKKNSHSLKEYFKTKKGKLQIQEQSKKQSIIMKEKIKNGEFKPCVTNSWTHWLSDIILNGKKIKFRSSWEASFYVSNQKLEYESFRIPYITETGENKTYVGDFYDRENNILYEIKPMSVYKTQIYKINKAINYCLKNCVKFIWINENNILDYIDKKDFSEYNMKQYYKMIKGIRNETSQNKKNKKNK